VSTGVLGRDVVVPMDSVDRVADRKVYLKVGKDALNNFQDYVEIQYRSPPEGWVPTSGFVYPMQATLWPADAYYPQISSVEVHTPPGTVGLTKGMEVDSSDGHKVGSIDALDTDPASGEVTGLVIKRGFLFTHDTRVPVEEVAEVSNERVKLRVTADQVRQHEET
jgi:sporulation protein YlmC with PRC-barrel domain